MLLDSPLGGLRAGRLQKSQQRVVLGSLEQSTACPCQPRCCLSQGQLSCPVYIGNQTCPSPLGMSA